MLFPFLAIIAIVIPTVYLIYSYCYTREEYLIHAGERTYRFPIWRLKHQPGEKVLGYCVFFNYTATFQPLISQPARLFGWLFRGAESLSLAWKYNEGRDRIEMYLKHVQDGVSVNKWLCDIELNTRYNMILELDSQCVFVKIMQTCNGRIKYGQTTHMIELNGSDWNMWLGPSLSGNQPAEKDIYIYLDKIRKGQIYK